MLKFEFWSIFEAVANIIILMILLRIFLFKPIRKMMDERTRSIQDDIDNAKKSREEAEALKQQYADDIGDALHRGGGRPPPTVFGYHQRG